jgi:hypothetical protein
MGDKIKQKGIIEPIYKKGDYQIIMGVKWIIEEVKEIDEVAYSIKWVKEGYEDKN